MKLFAAVALTLSVLAVSTTAAPIASPGGLGGLFGGLGNIVPLGDLADANFVDTESLHSPSVSNPSVESASITDDSTPAALARRDLLGSLGNLVPLGALTGANDADTESLVSPSVSNPSVESASITDDSTPATLARRDLLGSLGNLVPLGALTGANDADTESLVSPPVSNPSVESASMTDDSTPAALARRDLLGSLGNLVPLGALTGANDADTESLVSPSVSNPSVESASITDDATPAALTRRGLLPVDINAIIDAIVKVNTEVIVKATTELKINICADIRSKLHLVAKGLLTTDTDVVIPKVSAKIDSETRVIVNTKIDLDTRAIVLSNIGEHARHVIHKHCPQEGAVCISKAAGAIVVDVEALVKLDVDRLFIALKTNLMTHVRAKLQVLIHELGLNLIVEQIHLQGFVDAVVDVDIHLDLCAHVIVKGLHVTVVATAVAAIKSLLGL